MTSDLTLTDFKPDIMTYDYIDVSSKFDHVTATTFMDKFTTSFNPCGEIPLSTSPQKAPIEAVKDSEIEKEEEFLAHIDKKKKYRLLIKKNDQPWETTIIATYDRLRIEIITYITGDYQSLLYMVKEYNQDESKEVEVFHGDNKAVKIDLDEIMAGFTKDMNFHPFKNRDKEYKEYAEKIKEEIDQELMKSIIAEYTSTFVIPISYDHKPKDDALDASLFTSKVLTTTSLNSRIYVNDLNS
jgi:hypothetical protein